LRRANFRLEATRAFADHYVYNQTEVNLIEREAKSSGAEILVTTAKDAVKLKNLKFNLPCFVVEIEIVFDDDRPLREMLQKVDRR
jgi:tetraacyldisaccharide 4'-kinase